MTGPVERFAGQIASQGYVVGERQGDCSGQLQVLIKKKSVPICIPWVRRSRPNSIRCGRYGSLLAWRRSSWFGDCRYRSRQQLQGQRKKKSSYKCDWFISFQIEKKVEAYDEVGLLFLDSGSQTRSSFLLQDATLALDLLVSLKNCNGRLAGTVHPYLPART